MQTPHDKPGLRGDEEERAPQEAGVLTANIRRAFPSIRRCGLTGGGDQAQGSSLSIISRRRKRRVPGCGEVVRARGRSEGDG